MAEKTKVKDHEGIEIYLTPEGKFSASLKEKTIVRPTLRAIEKEIDARAKAFRSFFVDSSDYEVEEVFLLRFDSDGNIHTKTGIRKSWRSHPYVWDDDLVTSLRELHKRREKTLADFDREFQRIIKKAKEVKRSTLGQKERNF